jgi:NAD(P)-dependent dehydrogenase (short-subunit alcohol dehydrogenase family)
MKDFDDRVAVVTGSASGIGFETAKAFSAIGMRVALLDARSDAVKTAAQSISASGRRAIALSVDVSNEHAVQDAARQIVSELGTVDLLMNNAAVFHRGGDIADVDDDVWRWLLGVNLLGPIHCVRSFLPAMLDGGHGGHIVNTASISGFVVRDRQNGAYAATKSALVSYSEALRFDLQESGIGVSVVLPGAVASDFYVTSATHRGDLGGTNLFPTTPPDTAAGMTPAEVAARIVDGVQDGRFFIATHTNTRAMVEDRHAELMAAYDAAADWSGAGTGAPKT